MGQKYITNLPQPSRLHWSRDAGGTKLDQFFRYNDENSRLLELREEEEEEEQQQQHKKKNNNKNV
jgi:hypothetical protein